VEGEKVALMVVYTQRDSKFIGSQGDQRESKLLSGIQPSGPNGIEHLPILSSRCYGLRRSDKRFKGKRLLGLGFLLGWDHARHEDFL
jgi:hypothetical protein